MGEIKNRGARLSAQRALERRVQHQIHITELPGYLTGFTVDDIALDVSTARREVKDMVKAGLLTVTVLPGGKHQYRGVPQSIVAGLWVSRDNGIPIGHYQPGMGACLNTTT